MPNPATTITSPASIDGTPGKFLLARFYVNGVNAAVDTWLAEDTTDTRVLVHQFTLSGSLVFAASGEMTVEVREFASQTGPTWNAGAMRYTRSYLGYVLGGVLFPDKITAGVASTGTTTIARPASVDGVPGKFLLARLYLNGSPANLDFWLVEDTTDTRSGTHQFLVGNAATFADQGDVEFEVREFASQTGPTWNSGTLRWTRDYLGYVRAGNLYADAAAANQTATTHYSSRAAIEAAAGPSNVNVIADLQNNGDVSYIATRIEQALTESDSIIDAKFAQEATEVPTSGAYAARLSTIGAYYALVYLYRPRAIADEKYRNFLDAWQEAADAEVVAIAWALNRAAAASGAAVVVL